jgi:hypothetical protein
MSLYAIMKNGSAFLKKIEFFSNKGVQNDHSADP